MDTNIKQFINDVRSFFPKERRKTNALETLAWGTDAGFYRMIPKIVLFPKDEDEMRLILKLATKHNVELTFRAAGTSLSGQSISDSVLVVANKSWDSYKILDEGRRISAQTGVVGQHLNTVLAKYKTRFSPDPASIKSAMVGGIVSNNASGMCCGTHANSDKMIESARIILTDGTLLDTGDEQSKADFRKSHPEFLEAITKLHNDVMANQPLVDRINKKYSIKNVTGLNIRPLVAYTDPFEIITHSMVGAEGILAFLSECTFKTEDVQPFKATTMMYFEDLKTACEAVIKLKKSPAVSAEMFDRLALKAVEDLEGMPTYLKDFGPNVTALLSEVQAKTPEELKVKIAEVKTVLQDLKTVRPIVFTDIEAEYSKLWAMRSGIFPSVGAMREPGSTCLIEDIAFHIEDLPTATLELQKLIQKYGYKDGVIYGHAFEGNYHFILNQFFSKQADVDRYEGLMSEVIDLVVDKYDGSLKAEHGTGRNMAPFVEKEWGKDAFEIMKRLKAIFDPKGLLNPGVIFNDDPECYLKGFKPLPLVSPIVDKCIECGFCEVNCVTFGFTLSSRQRIVIRREIAQLTATGENPERLKELKKEYVYLGEATCAGDGLCSTSCPMGINTGDLTHLIREENNPIGSMGWKVGKFSAEHFSQIKSVLRPVLGLANAAHTVLGTPIMNGITGGLHKVGVPLWRSSMPKRAKVHPKKLATLHSKDKVVYFPSCINQTMGVAKGTPYNDPLADVMTGLLQKAGYEVIFPEGMENLCCGTIWESKGMPDIADKKTAELEAALWEATEHGKYPVLCDQSPCLYRMVHEIKSMDLYEPVEFIEKFLVKKLDFHRIDEPIAIHTTCSMTKMKLVKELHTLADRCSSQVLFPEGVGCCAFAGDKGFTQPEVNKFALRKLKPQIDANSIKVGYSNSRTCEIGLMTNGGIPYVSLVYLVNKVTTPKTK